MNHVCTKISLGLLSVSLAACASDPEPIGQAPVGDAPTARPAIPSDRVQAELAGGAEAMPQELGELYSAMDSVGTGSEDAYVERLQRFLSSGNALEKLKSAYASFPREAAAKRWSIAYLAREIHSRESAEFLEQIVLTPQEKTKTEESGDGHGQDQHFGIQLTAAMSVVHQFTEGVADASPSITRLMSQANREIARQMAVELFSRGTLDDSQRRLLAERGIFTNFRRHTPEEWAELSKLNPDATGHQVEKTEAKPVRTAVPAPAESE